MHLRHENGIPFRCGDVLMEIDGFKNETHYTSTACVSHPRGNDKIGHLTSSPLMPEGGVKIRKFNGDTVWWTNPPTDPTGLMAAMRNVMGLLSGDAIQITIEVCCRGEGRKTHYWESHIIHDLAEIDALLIEASNNALRSRRI